MKNSHAKLKQSSNVSFLSVLLICCFLFTGSSEPVLAQSTESSYILLSSYREEIKIGDEFYLFAWTSNGKKPSWKSSDSKIASVNTYGLVTGKKAGTAKITAKISGAEISCRVTVDKTEISLNQTKLSLERGETAKLTALTSNRSAVTWKSSKKSVALIDENGTVTAVKPGEAVLTASADGTSVTCTVTVKQPKITLNKTSVTLYRGQTVKLSATVSSGIQPTWQTNKKSVAIVDEYGIVTAIKHGTAVITVKLDGVSKLCTVTVAQPKITLSSLELNLKTGETARLTAKVSSGNPVTWSVSKQQIAGIDSTGKVTAYEKGTCYIYATEDGVKERCILHVTDS
jgi:uncharacterized protein YjdB